MSHSNRAVEKHLKFKVASDGSVPEDTACPFCFQRRPSHFFYLWVTLDEGTEYAKRVRKTTTKCLTCRRKEGLERWKQQRQRQRS